MSQARCIDPIEHAWRRCNPHSPLPSALVPRAMPSDLALGLSSSNGQPMAEVSGVARDTACDLLALAILPRISRPEG